MEGNIMIQAIARAGMVILINCRTVVFKFRISKKEDSESYWKLDG